MTLVTEEMLSQEGSRPSPEGLQDVKRLLRDAPCVPHRPGFVRAIGGKGRCTHNHIDHEGPGYAHGSREAQNQPATTEGERPESDNRYQRRRYAADAGIGRPGAATLIPIQSIANPVPYMGAALSVAQLAYVEKDVLAAPVRDDEPIARVVLPNFYDTLMHRNYIRNSTTSPSCST